MKKLIRELKINFILNEEEELLPISKIDDSLFPDKKYNYIITGSYILRIFGLLDRNNNDFDLAFNNSEDYSKFITDYKLLQNTSGYIDNADERCKTYKGFVEIKGQKYDLFLNNYLTKDILEINNFKILNPYKIINHKIDFLDNELINKKHFKDLLYINTKLN